MYLVFEGASRQIGRHIDAIAVHVELPAVVDAHHAAFLIDGEEQGCATVRTPFVDQPNLPVRVTEGNQVFSQEPDANRCTISLRELPLIGMDASIVGTTPPSLFHGWYLSETSSLQQSAWLPPLFVGL